MKTVLLILVSILISFGTIFAEDKKPNPKFLNLWKKIQTVNKKRAYETQQTRTVAGVRGSEAHDAILDQLYYKGGVRYPSRVDLSNAIQQLNKSIVADPKANDVPEKKFFVAQCHVQLGQQENAQKCYQDLVDNYGETKYGKLSKIELEK
jgi:tetratricopeptide (TPR) repeat protein